MKEPTKDSFKVHHIKKLNNSKKQPNSQEQSWNKAEER